MSYGEKALVILAIGGLVSVPVLLVLVGKWIVGPLDVAARKSQAPIRFQMSDLLTLAAQLQVALMLPIYIADSGLREMSIGIGALIIGSVTVWWAGCVTALSRAGVVSGWKRAAFILVALPAALGGLALMIVLNANSLRLALAGDGLRSTMLLIINVLAIVGFYGARRVTLWVISA